jgi:hypothetical protein
MVGRENPRRANHVMALQLALRREYHRAPQCQNYSDKRTPVFKQSIKPMVLCLVLAQVNAVFDRNQLILLIACSAYGFLTVPQNFHQYQFFAVASSSRFVN